MLKDHQHLRVVVNEFRLQHYVTNIDVTPGSNNWTPSDLNTINKNHVIGTEYSAMTHWQ